MALTACSALPQKPLSTVQNTPQATTISVIEDSNLFVTGILPDSYSATSNSAINAAIGQTLPVPLYLPQRYEIKEAYSSSNDILILISDQANTWQGKQYQCRLAFYTDWGGISGGFKGLTGERQFLPGTNIFSVLEIEDDEYILSWQNDSVYSEYYVQKSAIVKLYSSKYFPKVELYKVAVSVPQIVSTTKVPVSTGTGVTSTITGIPSPLTSTPASMPTVSVRP